MADTGHGPAPGEMAPTTDAVPTASPYNGRTSSHTRLKGRPTVPRFIVERTFPDGLQIPITAEGAKAFQSVVEANSADGVTWVHSYVTPDRHKTFCVYDAPDEAAISRTAERNALPVDSITEVRVLDPYFYH
jgi:hypothetical protein